MGFSLCVDLSAGVFKVWELEGSFPTNSEGFLILFFFGGGGGVADMLSSLLFVLRICTRILVQQLQLRFRGWL